MDLQDLALSDYGLFPHQTRKGLAVLRADEEAAFGKDVGPDSMLYRTSNGTVLDVGLTGTVTQLHSNLFSSHDWAVNQSTALYEHLGTYFLLSQEDDELSFWRVEEGQLMLQLEMKV